MMKKTKRDNPPPNPLPLPDKIGDMEGEIVLDIEIPSFTKGDDLGVGIKIPSVRSIQTDRNEILYR